MITAATSLSSPIEEWSVATAYVAVLLLGVSLSLGPLNVLRRTHNPIHSPVRRDLGIAAGIFALVHTILGLQVHMGGSLSRYFTLPRPQTTAGTAFVVANYVGLLSALVLALLLMISNNPAIRKFGLTKWKRAQRLAYVAAIAAAIHGLAYQLLEERTLILVGALAAVSIGIWILQMRGAAAHSRGRD
jgi:sulfoxide reductase heme-binding subunit YedZ